MATTMKNRIAVIRNGQIVYIDESSPVVKPNETAAYESREDQKVRHRKDILQRNETAFYRAYPEQLENLNPELRRLLS